VIRGGFALTHVTAAEARALAEQLLAAATVAEGRHASQTPSRLDDFKAYIAEQPRATGVSSQLMWGDAGALRARCAEALKPFIAPQAGLLLRGGVVRDGSVRAYLAHLEQGGVLSPEARQPVPWRRGVLRHRDAVSVARNVAQGLMRFAARAARGGAVRLQAWRK
jgi:hypothetical protein